jgi:hypothetical protein
MGWETLENLIDVAWLIKLWWWKFVVAFIGETKNK